MRIPIFGREMARMGTLRNASAVGYKRVMNDLHTASFRIPVDDQDNRLCETVHAIVDIVDGERSAGLYRIGDEPEEDITSEGAFLQYECEHVLAFLFDDSIDGYLEIGGTGIYTEDVIEYLLGLQSVKRWTLGRCDFHFQFAYSWDKEDLLNALFAIPKCFDAGYRWTYDTSSYPWTINLVRTDDTRNCEIRYRRNMRSIRRGKDVSRLCTRLYCFGSGEGVNQTNIRSVNPTGKNYIDSENIAKYGVVSKKLIDHSISDDQMLFSKGETYLKSLENPLYSYEVKAADLHRKTGLAFDLIDEGKLVRVVDEQAGIDFDKHIVSVEKKDVEGKPLDIDVVFANHPSDVSSALDDISAKTAITAQYAQGATNLYAMQASDNADQGHPAVMNFYVPAACSKINQVLLSWRLEHFRAYETGAAAGGGDARTTLEGGGSTQTSQSGGQTTVTVPSRTTRVEMSSGGPVDSDGGSVSHTSSDGNHRHSATLRGGMSGHGHKLTGSTTQTGGLVSTPDQTVSGNTGYAGSHDHDMTHHHSITHEHVIPSAQLEIPGHTHDVNVPSHSHSFTILSHQHEIVYGIFEGGMASGVTIKVDGVEIPADQVSGSEIDVIPYLRKNSDGRIVRGTWHEVSIVPNDLTRVQANLFVQTFVTSYTGGTY